MDTAGKLRRNSIQEMLSLYT